MIITKNWLNEHLNLGEIDINELANRFNDIGLEVGKIEKISVPEKVVIAQILSVAKVEGSNKLNLCIIDCGNDQLEIVCGAANVREGAFVALAKIGAKIGDMKIKAAKLRGVQSFGMLCSAKELGLFASEEGIMVLDESIGELVLGKELREYELFNDYLIDLELTPNRGDCLSIHGVAREMSAALGIELKTLPVLEKSNENQGIGRLIGIRTVNESDVFMSFMAIKKEDKLCQVDYKRRFRLAMLEKLGRDNIQNLLFYSSYVSGVILCAYDFSKLCKDCKVDDKIILDLKREEKGELGVYYKDMQISVAGIWQNKDYSIDENSEIIIIQASYTLPSIIMQAAASYEKKDDFYYQSSRGSESDLDMGLALLTHFISKNKDLYVYSGVQKVSHDFQPKILSLNLRTIQDIIGTKIEKNEALKILKSLGFELHLVNEEQISLRVPPYRQDIENIFDISEELVRMIGIKNILKRPLSFIERPRQNEASKNHAKILDLRSRAVGAGFFESIFYILDNEAALKKLGFALCKNQLINPITSELGVLRPSMINQLLRAASLNLKNSIKSIKLFSVGKVFTPQGDEETRFSLIYSGLKEESKVSNHAKPASIDFYSLLELLQSILGSFELAPCKIGFLSPYEQAIICKDGVELGFVGRVHLAVEKDYELCKSYVCEIDFNALKSSKKEAREFSKYQSSSRDISILAPIGYDFGKIKKCINELKIPILEKCTLIDIFHDESLGDQNSLTLNFIFRDQDKTLTDEEINETQESIIQALSSRLDLKLR